MISFKNDIKKKRLTYLLCEAIFVFFILLSFTSCWEDLENDISIVGTWVDGNTTMLLGQDGSYYTYLGSNPTGKDSQYRKGTYSYNPNQSLFTINVVAVPNHNGAYKNTYIVQTLTKTTLVLLYTDGDVEGYYTRK